MFNTHNTHNAGMVPPRNIKDVLIDAGRQLLASFIILAIGFFALNWSAYYKIAKNEWEKIWGQEESPLTYIVEEAPKAEPQKDLQINKNIKLQKSQIPPLNI